MTQWTDALGRPKECIYRFQRSLVGLTHPNKQGHNRIALAQKLRTGMQLLLVPEPNNPVDRDAILIYSGDDPGNDLGYLDSIGAKQICRMIECGANFSAEVFWINNHNHALPKVYIYVFQLTATTRSHRPARKNAPRYERPIYYRGEDRQETKYLPRPPAEMIDIHVAPIQRSFIQSAGRVIGSIARRLRF